MILDAPAPTTGAAPTATWRWTGLAFLYWLTCMAALEPGNLAGMRDMGARPSWGFEAMRLAAAGVLGASATPALIWLSRRFPLRRPLPVRGLLALALSMTALAVGLILVSCVLAALLRRGAWAPTAAEVRRELAANGLLVLACLSGFLGLIHLRSGARPAGGPAAPPAHPRRLIVRDGGQVIVVDLGRVDWIETQGNYQALHTDEGVRLVRATQAGLMAQLDPAMFVRIHRRTLVAAGRIERVERLPNGDGIVRLTSGAELRLARTHRAALLARLET